MILNYTKSLAYVATGYKFDEPRHIYYFLASSASTYKTILNNTVPTWNVYTSVNITKTSSETKANIKLYYDGANGNSYATTNRTDRNHYQIYFHKPFSNLSDLKKKETILHEVGHALGLDHTQVENYSRSIMWDGQNGTHFHNVAYPLADDTNGIKNIYNFYK